MIHRAPMQRRRSAMQSSEHESRNQWTISQDESDTIPQVPAAVSARDSSMLPSGHSLETMTILPGQRKGPDMVPLPSPLHQQSHLPVQRAAPGQNVIPIQRMQASGSAPAAARGQTWGDFLWGLLGYSATGANQTATPDAPATGQAAPDIQPNLPASTDSNDDRSTALAQPLPTAQTKTKQGKTGDIQTQEGAHDGTSTGERLTSETAPQPAAVPSVSPAPVVKPLDRNTELQRLQVEAQDVMDFLQSAPGNVKQTAEWKAAVTKITNIISRAPELITSAEESALAVTIANLGVGITRIRSSAGYQATESAKLVEERERRAAEARAEHRRFFDELADRVIRDIERIRRTGNRGIDLVGAPGATADNAAALYASLRDRYHNKPAAWAGPNVKYYIVRGPQTKIDITGHKWKNGSDVQYGTGENEFNYHVNW